MSARFNWPEPAWLAAIPDEQKREESRVRFLISLASLYAGENGSVMDLSESLGLGKTTLSAAKTRGRVGSDVALKIEQTVGAELFPWHLFRPDLVVNQE